MPVVYGPRIERVPAMFSALANSNRRSILHMIGTSQMSGTEMSRNLGISQQAVSRHIAVLVRAGLVSRLGWEGYCIDAGGINELLYFIRRYLAPPDNYRRQARWT